MNDIQSQTAEELLEAILKKIGPINFKPPLNFEGPHDSDDENELWAREKAIQFRHVYERHPDHEAALSCIEQHAELEMEQSFLFAKIHDDLNATEFEVSGLYRRFDFNDEKYIQKWRQATKPIRERQDARAAEILSKYPDLGLAEWAYNHVIRKHGMKLLETRGGNIKKIESLIEELTQTVEKYVKLGHRKHTSIEPYDGYYDFGSIQSVHFLTRAVDALEPRGRSAQSALLNKISDMFPGNEEIAKYDYKFNSFEEPFELEFKDVVSGDSVNIRDYRGKVVILDFWATWCQPCLAFVPYMKKIVSRYSNDVTVIGISSDDAEIGDQASEEQRRKVEAMVAECAAKHGMDWPILLDWKIHEKWRITGIPTIFVVDRRGILRSFNAHTTLAKTVRKLLKEG